MTRALLTFDFFIDGLVPELTHFSPVSHVYTPWKRQGVWKCDTGLKWVNFLKNLAISYNFRSAYKIGSKLRKTVLVVEKLIRLKKAYFHFRGMFTDILKRINYDDEWQVINCCYLNWFITETDLLVNIFFTEKAIWIQIRFFGWGKVCMSYCIKKGHRI